MLGGRVSGETVFNVAAASLFIGAPLAFSSGGAFGMVVSSLGSGLLSHLKSGGVPAPYDQISQSTLGAAVLGIPLVPAYVGMKMCQAHNYDLIAQGLETGVFAGILTAAGYPLGHAMFQDDSPVNRELVAACFGVAVAAGVAVGTLFKAGVFLHEQFEKSE